MCKSGLSLVDERPLEMIKSLMLAGMLAAAAAPAIADGAMATAPAEPRHAVAATGEQRCLEPKTWLPGTLQIENGSPAGHDSLPLAQTERAPRHADCALV